MMSHRILPAALLLCTLTAACGENPTGTPSEAHPAGPAYNGGFGMGGGWTGTGSAPGQQDETSDGTTTTTSSDGTDRSGGFGMGGG